MRGFVGGALSGLLVGAVILAVLSVLDSQRPGDPQSGAVPSASPANVPQGDPSRPDAPGLSANDAQAVAPAASADPGTEADPAADPGASMARVPEAGAGRN
ncbi:hypothetical protein [Rubellimicrobium arenae]|uniref:hypothetical protein n=1 Tax=Rubellimicrobium arenae TaxID=2817372 RepID=UPI001B315A3C|nr:hypothetical protein [Rubellimicrobium arenae]